MTSLEKQPSPELLSLIKAAAQSLLGFGELWNSIKMKGKDEGFTERELQDILRPLLKPQLNKDQIYYLFNAEQRKENAKEQYHRNITTIFPKKDPEQNNKPPPEPSKEPPKNPPIQEPEEEEPTELELLKIENEQLKDALHKTEQFKPATALEQLPKVIESADKEDQRVHSWLKNSADGIGSFYYDTYGIDLFKNRELTQLKNSGVKVFKRLYFEV